MATNLYSSRTSNDAQIRKITEDISEIFIKDSKDLISLDFNKFMQKIEQISLKLEMIVKSYTLSSGKIENIKTNSILKDLLVNFCNRDKFIESATTFANEELRSEVVSMIDFDHLYYLFYGDIPSYCKNISIVILC